MPGMECNRIILSKCKLGRIIAAMCSLLMMAGIVGNLFILRPRPLNQPEHGTESLGHTLVQIMSLILLQEKTKRKNLKTWRK